MRVANVYTDSRKLGPLGTLVQAIPHGRERIDMDNEIVISGITISKDVIATVVTIAAEKVAGVASVDGRNLTSSLISMFTSKPAAEEKRSVDAEVEDGKLKVTIRLAVFFGYPFTKLADGVRAAVAQAVSEQIGVEVSSVDVCIDDLVFPKE